MASIFDRMADALDNMYEQKWFETRLYDAGNSFSRLWLFAKYLFYIWTFAVFLTFVILIFASPLLIQSENRLLLGMGAITYNIVSALMMCHQLPMRSLFTAGVQQAVCARDAGIYLGIAAAGLIFLKGTPQILKTKKFLLLATIPIAIDGITQTILNLRESNNLLRITTGLLFGFGITLFLLNRIKTLNQPEFRENLRNKKFALTLAACMILSLAAFMQASSFIGGIYSTKNDAIRAAGKTASDRLLVFYIPPRSPLSLYLYPSKQLYSDNVLTDVWSMDYIAENINLMTNDTYLLNQTNPLDFTLPLKHYYGMWAVVDTSGPAPSGGGAVIYTSDSGDYSYIDAADGKVFESRRH